MSNMRVWDKVSKPPANALKQITGGRLTGKTDINPQWRMEVMTALFGPCGTGWKYTIENVWCEPCTKGEVAAFASINLSYKEGDTWSDAVPGIGGSMLVENEKSGPHNNNEAYKMAVTDALSVAMKALGVGSDIYRGRWDGSKYIDSPTVSSTPQPDERKGLLDAIASWIKNGGFSEKEIAFYRKSCAGKNAKELCDVLADVKKDAEAKKTAPKLDAKTEKELEDIC